MFLIAPIWNIIITIAFVLLSILSPSSAKDFGVAIPPSFMWYHAMYFFVFLFGLLFYVTSRNLEKYHDLATIFVVEKFGAFFLFLIYFILGEFNILGLPIIIIDLVFGILFLEFWLKFK